MEMDNVTRELLYLMRCALQGTPPEPADTLDYGALYQLSASHSVVAMTAMALEDGGLLTEEHMPAELIRKWKDAKVKAIRKNILLDAEREVILGYFEEQGIWYMPLKGAILKDMYPKMGMRQMSDNDILFDGNFRKPLKAFMESRGYQTAEFNSGNHDVYEKPPVYNFELHTELFDRYEYSEWSSYYSNICESLVKDTENRWGYHFSDEDFYVYLLVHGYKHYSVSGTGIRFLSDIYVFLREKQDGMDWAYVHRELETLNISEFEAQTRVLAQKLFGKGQDASLEDTEQTVLAYLMGAGTYGTVENRVNRKMEKIQAGDGPVSMWTKVRYAWQRLFPDRDFMKRYSPICRKYPWSIPFMRIYRLVWAVAVRRKAIGREVQAMQTQKKD